MSEQTGELGQHQILPWRVRLDGDRAAVLDANGFAVAVDLLPAEAGFIVRAVNSHAAFATALERIEDWSECQCDHDSADCCANVADHDFHCPGCIAARAREVLHGPSVPSPRQE